jgi:hypothetical protein
MITFQDKLNEIVPAFQAFGNALGDQWKKTNLKEFFTVKQLFAQYKTIYQLIIEGTLLIVSAAVAIALIEAFTSVILTFALLANLLCMAMAVFQVLVNQNKEEGRNWFLYAMCASAVLSLTPIIAPLICVATIGLVGYKSSDLIKAALPASVKTNTFDMAKNSWTWLTQKVNAAQKAVTNCFNP